MTRKLFKNTYIWNDVASKTTREKEGDRELRSRSDVENENPKRCLKGTKSLPSLSTLEVLVLEESFPDEN